MVYSYVVQGILKEKSSKMKEVMKIMGLHWHSYFASYFIVEFSLGVLFALITSIFAFYDKGFTILQTYNLFFAILIFVVGIIGLAFFLCTLVSSERLGGFLAFIIYFLPLGFYTHWEVTQKAFVYYGLLFIAPHYSFYKTIGSIYINDGNAWKLMYVQMIPCAILWVLFIYFEQIMPSRFGVVKSPCFCFNQKEKKYEKHLDEEQEGLMEDFITISHASKRYGQFEALHDISFGMKIGEVFCILGPNGSGKTTLIDMLIGMLNPSSGNIRVNDNDLQENIDIIRRKTGYCSQETILYEELTVSEYFDLFEGIKSASHLESENILRKLLLYDSKHKQINTLSGGQKRKLAVGTAFIGSSNFIVLDEPTVGMDANSRQGLWELITEQKQSRLILLTTQNLEEADELANRICILNAGEMIEQPQPPIAWKKKYGYGYKLIVEPK